METQFRIGELAKELNIEKFVIRFWEKEFGVATSRSEGGQRFYTEKNFEFFKNIKSLLYDQGFTIAGAKKFIAEQKKVKNSPGSYKTKLKEEASTSEQSLAGAPSEPEGNTSVQEAQTTQVIQAPILNTELAEKMLLVKEKLTALRELL